MQEHNPNNLLCLNEQRRRRSEDPLVAVQLQLQQVVEDFGLDGCVVATIDGLLVAAPASLDVQLAEEIAAMATLHADHPASSHTQAPFHHPNGQLSSLSVQPFWALHQHLLVAAIAQPDLMAAPALFRTILGARRIWGEHEKIPA